MSHFYTYPSSVSDTKAPLMVFKVQEILIFSPFLQITKTERPGSLWREECCLLELIVVIDILIFFNVTAEKWGWWSCVAKQYVEAISEMFWLLSASVSWKYSPPSLSLWRTVVVACFFNDSFWWTYIRCCPFVRLSLIPFVKTRCSHLSISIIMPLLNNCLTTSYCH